ncbi:hypothetical protein BOX15_Mlig007323g4, partial [Macrostomum lignano]
MHLARQVGVGLSDMGFWFTAKSAAACLLALLTGFVFNRLPDSSRLARPAFLAAGNLVSAGAMLGASLARSCALALSLAGLLGAGHGALETANGILVIRLLGSLQSRPILHSLHFCTALGGLIAPLMLHPFLAANDATEPPIDEEQQAWESSESACGRVGSGASNQSATRWHNLKTPALATSTSPASTVGGGATAAPLLLVTPYSVLAALQAAASVGLLLLALLPASPLSCRPRCRRVRHRFLWKPRRRSARRHCRLATPLPGGSYRGLLLRVCRRREHLLVVRWRLRQLRPGPPAQRARRRRPAGRLLCRLSSRPRPRRCRLPLGPADRHPAGAPGRLPGSPGHSEPVRVHLAGLRRHGRLRPGRLRSVRHRRHLAGAAAAGGRPRRLQLADRRPTGHVRPAASGRLSAGVACGWPGLCDAPGVGLLCRCFRHLLGHADNGQRLRPVLATGLWATAAAVQLLLSCGQSVRAELLVWVGSGVWEWGVWEW